MRQGSRRLGGLGFEEAGCRGSLASSLDSARPAARSLAWGATRAPRLAPAPVPQHRGASLPRDMPCSDHGGCVSEVRLDSRLTYRPCGDVVGCHGPRTRAEELRWKAARDLRERRRKDRALEIGKAMGNASDHVWRCRGPVLASHVPCRVVVEALFEEAHSGTPEISQSRSPRVRDAVGYKGTTQELGAA